MLPGPEAHHAEYSQRLPDGRLECQLCPRACALRDGQAGLCFIRERQGERIRLTSYGRSHGFCIDPIEKKPLHHFYPGSPVLSFGTAGCNLNCAFCQNWEISHARELERHSAAASPERIAQTATELGCTSVAYTYNDPVIFLEYVVDTARACRQRGIKNVAVTAGYISPRAREDFFRHIDAANVDLKAFSERFYRRLCGGHLAPVLDTLCYLRQESQVWLELTTLLIPGENDSPAELHQLCAWVAEHLGVDTPIHFSAYHPAWRLQAPPPTPPETLCLARHIAMQQGLRFVYTGNLRDPEGNTTWCPHCQRALIERSGYQLGHWGLNAEAHCRHCGYPLPGHFAPTPGTWGARRQPVRLTEE